MKYKSPISVRVGNRSELDQKFAQWIESLPDNVVLSEEIKRCCVENVELRREVSDIENIKAKIAHQEYVLRELEAKIKAGIIIEKPEAGDSHKAANKIDEEKVKRIKQLAANMTDW